MHQAPRHVPESGDHANNPRPRVCFEIRGVSGMVTYAYSQRISTISARGPSSYVNVKGSTPKIHKINLGNTGIAYLSLVNDRILLAFILHSRKKYWKIGERLSPSRQQKAPVVDGYHTYIGISRRKGWFVTLSYPFTCMRLLLQRRRRLVVVVACVEKVCQPEIGHCAAMHVHLNFRATWQYYSMDDNGGRQRPVTKLDRNDRGFASFQTNLLWSARDSARGGWLLVGKSSAISRAGDRSNNGIRMSS